MVPRNQDSKNQTGQIGPLPKETNPKAMFPQPLVAFEKFMWHDHQPSSPNCIALRVRFTGRIDKQAATEATEEIAARHPVVGTHSSRDRRGRLIWVQHETPPRLWIWHELSQDEPEPQLSPVHADDQVFQFTFFSRPNSCELISIGSHAAFDGVGGMQALAEWTVAYAKRVGEPNKKLKLRKLDDERFQKRGEIGIFNRSYLSKLLYQPIGLFGAAKFFFRRVCKLVPDRPLSDEMYENFPTTVHHVISAQETESLKDLSTKHDVTMYVLLLRELFHSMVQWRTSRGHHRPKDWYRVLIPMNTRTIADRRLSACNRATFVQLDRREKNLQDPDGLLQGIFRELKIIRHAQLEKLASISVQIMSKIPGMLKRSAKSRTCRSTTILTHVGSPYDRLGHKQEGESLRVGNLLLDDYELVVPIRHHTPVGISASNFLGKTLLTLHYDPRIIDRSDAQELLDHFGKRLSDLATN